MSFWHWWWLACVLAVFLLAWVAWNEIQISRELDELRKLDRRRKR